MASQLEEPSPEERAKSAPDAVTDETNGRHDCPGCPARCTCGFRTEVVENGNLNGGGKSIVICKQGGQLSRFEVRPSRLRFSDMCGFDNLRVA